MRAEQISRWPTQAAIPRAQRNGIAFGCIAVTATFRILYVLVVMEHASRRLIHPNATAHPTAARTLQQLRESIPSDHQYRFIVHDRDAIFSSELNASLTRLGLKVITTPVHSPQANSFVSG